MELQKKNKSTFGIFDDKRKFVDAAESEPWGKIFLWMKNKA